MIKTGQVNNELADISINMTADEEAPQQMFQEAPQMPMSFQMYSELTSKVFGNDNG